ncbi:MAG: sugar phosphate isomerase/epimerase [Desulfobacteraceae bacterium]|nr:MAG: sugar phosphate isomerase/epimerase [Desulfobacteraceae bacterium]
MEEKAMPIIGLSTYSLFLKMGYREAMRFAVQHGFKGVEIWSNVFDFPPWAVSAADIDFIKGIASENNLRLAIHFCESGNDLCAINKGHLEESRDQLRETIRIMNRIGSGLIVVHPGQCPELSVHKKNPLDAYPKFQLKTLHEKALIRFMDSLADAAKCAEDFGVLIGLENFSHVKGCVQHELEEIAEWVDDVGSPALKITLDTGHANLEGGVEQAIELYGSRIAHVHLDDNNGKSSQHGEVGSGTIDWTAIAPFLQAFEGMLSLEVLGFDDPEGAVLRSKVFLEDLLDAPQDAAASKGSANTRTETKGERR